MGANAPDSCKVMKNSDWLTETLRVSRISRDEIARGSSKASCSLMTYSVIESIAKVKLRFL